MEKTYKVMGTEEFSKLIVEFTEKTNRSVIMDIQEVGDNATLSLDIDEEFLDEFESNYSEYDFERTINLFVEDAIKGIMNQDEDLE